MKALQRRNPGRYYFPAFRCASCGLHIAFVRQRGLALITAMLVVAIAATTAAYLSLDQQIWTRQAQNLSDRAQAEVVRAGALEWAITILAKDARDSQSDDLTEDWAKDLPPLAVEGGQVAGRIIDAQGKFNLNNLLRGGKPSPPDIGAFRHLLQSLQINPDLTDAVIDWIDADSNASAAGAEDIDYLQLPTPYRAANQPLQSVEELRLVRGFTREMVDKLLPLVTALPPPTDVNVNTAPKEILGAVYYTLPASAIGTLISDRPYADLAKLTPKLQQLAGAATLPQAFVGTKSSYFEVEITTLFGRHQRSTQALIQRGAGTAGFRTLWVSQRLPYRLAGPETTSGENPDTAAGGNI
jgi:general secretion pathway protein K